MKTVVHGLRLIGTHAIMSIVEFFLMLPLMGLWESNQWYQWGIGIVLISFFWLIIYSDVNYLSQIQIKRNWYSKSKGFIIGAIATLPGFILYILSLILNGDINYSEILLRIWLSPYSKVLITFPNQMPHIALIPILILPVLTGLSYLDGPRRRDKVMASIKNAEERRLEASKVDKE